ncbi:CBS domain containing-hemolysin-like protein [Fluviicoccus keumensis]|uniref:Polyamine export protein n=1 Tax=Fluviicoccus keumensis TaxID=1435465 RepID=A0A4Q7ZAY3_9GAMM|nr:hemolysin family protein [Fluviicoccus keumensis]RZU47762.1 CBS domain containing-hemolysin-like protein [Fluviicoccus keumensis]
MSLFQNLLVIAFLVIVSAFFSFAEIGLASARRIRLQQMIEAGDARAGRVLALQEQPGIFFTVVQVALNAIAILGGIVGEQALSPFLASGLHSLFGPAPWIDTAGLLLSFLLVTSLFIIFADLMPKRLAMTWPEQVAVLVVKPIGFCLAVLKPVVLMYDGIATGLFGLLGIQINREDRITFDDVSAMVDAGTASGALHKQEQHLIENVFELDTRTVTFAMTPRDSVVFLRLQDDDQQLKAKISDHPHSKFLVCDDHIDSVVGFVESKDILKRTLNQQAISLNRELVVKNILAIPDTLTLSELLERFKVTNQDLALILNEYALVVGIVTLNDVMKTLMGDLVSPFTEEQIVRRDEHSWLVDGVTPVEDLKRALDLDALPHEEQYQTVAGFLMFQLKKIPKRTDSVEFAGYKFEVVDIDNYRIDQVLVTRLSGQSD